ncbi:MAG: alpha/beta fold hydrolase [Alphaproteobacteria bacterium]
MKYGIFLAALVLSGCSWMVPQPSGFVDKKIETEYLTFSVWEKEGIEQGKPLRIYLEGDGNPNPSDKVALYYAQKDPFQNVIYMGRPCQWSEDKICKSKPEIYGQQRFHPELVREIEEVVLYLKGKYKAPAVELVGYDGGATIALNLAGQTDVARVITIAGILDTNAYTRQNDFPEMADAQNPADKLAVLAKVPQIHYVGGKDEITPRRSAERFVAKMKHPTSAVVKSVPGVGHTNWQGIELDY